MNRNSLLAVALIAMVCTGLGVASVPQRMNLQFPMDAMDTKNRTLSITGNDTMTMVMDGEDEYGLNLSEPVGWDPITDEDGNVIGVSYNATNRSGEVVASFAPGDGENVTNVIEVSHNTSDDEFFVYEDDGQLKISRRPNFVDRLWTAFRGLW